MFKSKILLASICLSILFLITGSVFAQDYDLGGKTVSMVGIGIEQFEDDADGPFAGRLSEIEEKYNCKIVEIETHWSQPDEYLARLMAGDSTYDIWNILQWRFWPFIEVGALYPLDDVLVNVLGSEPYSDYISVAQDRYEHHNYRGSHYVMVSNEGDGSEFVYFNKELFEREGLPDPYELYQNGEWTLENYRDIALQAAKDTDNDGEIDQWGIHWRGWHHSFYNATELVKVEDGRYVFNLVDNPGFAEGHEFARDMYAADAVIHDNELERFFSGKIAMSTDSTLRLPNEPEGQNMSYGILPFPKGSYIDEHIAVSVGLGGAALPANVEQPEALAAIYHDFFRMEDGEIATNEIIRRWAQDPVAAEVILKARTEWETRYTQPFPFINGEINSIRGDILWRGQSPAEAVEAYASSAQQKLDDMLNN